MSPAGPRNRGLGLRGPRSPMYLVWRGLEGVLYSEIQCIMGNGHMGTTPWTDRQTPMKALLSHNFIGGW